MHLHGHGNKMVPFIKPSILMHLIMALSFVVAFVGQLMTLTAIVSHVKSVTPHRQQKPHESCRDWLVMKFLT